MNIFVLDLDPILAARMACDKHVVKMVLESSQLLCSPYENTAPYKRSHYNHPASKWTRESKQNYEWLIKYAEELSREYSYRYGKIHKSSSVISWCTDNIEKIKFNSEILTEHAQCFGDFFEQCYTPNNPVEGYKKYYKIAKKHILKYTKREIPNWLDNAL